VNKKFTEMRREDARAPRRPPGVLAWEMPGSGVNGLARFDLDASNAFSEKRNIWSGPLGVDSPVSTDGRFAAIIEYVFVIPEPSTFALTALAFLAAVCRGRTRRV
jgi:hypothetical protein